MLRAIKILFNTITELVINQKVLLELYTALNIDII
jgi:hypothetical protein